MSKIAKDIYRSLASRNFHMNGEENRQIALYAIDSALEGRTIKKSELDRIQDDARQTTYLKSILHGRDQELRNLQETNTINIENYAQLKQKYTELLAVKVVHLVNELNNVPEELNPPACLKPKDALAYQNQRLDNAALGYQYKYSWQNKSCEPLESALFPAKKANPLKKHFGRIAISLLLVTVLALGYVSYKQNQVIVYQQQILREAYVYVLQNCPPVTQDPSRERTQNEPLNNPEQHR